MSYVTIEKKQTWLIAILCFVAAMYLLLGRTATVFAACPSSLPSDKGSVSAVLQIPTAGNYRLWSRIKTPDTTNDSYYLKIDTSCFEVGNTGNIPVNTWTWVDYQDGNSNTRITMDLTAGLHTVQMVGSEAGVELDRVLAVVDQNCIPEVFGDNCGVAQPDFSMTGVVEGQTVADGISLQAIPNNASEIRFDFYLDASATPYNTEQVAPYCFGGDTGTCNLYDTNQLTNGNHSIRVVMSHSGGTLEKVVNFIVNNEIIPLPTDPCLTAPTGDVDCDQVVGGSDFLIIRNSMRRIPPYTNPTRQQGNIYSADNVVDGKDFALYIVGLRAQNQQ